MSMELEPCPLCNHIARHEAHVRGPYAIVCPVCRVRISRDDRNECITAWNTRPSTIRANALEEAARVAEEYTKGGTITWAGNGIAAAIRTLAQGSAGR